MPGVLCDQTLDAISANAFNHAHCLFVFNGHYGIYKGDEADAFTFNEGVLHYSTSGCGAFQQVITQIRPLKARMQVMIGGAANEPRMSQNRLRFQCDLSTIS